jgi:hypothetical protein
LLLLVGTHELFELSYAVLQFTRLHTGDHRAGQRRQGVGTLECWCAAGNLSKRLLQTRHHRL